MWKTLGVALLIVIGGLLLWGLIEPRLYVVEEESAPIAGLPTAWKGRRVAQISDFQLGLFLDNDDTIEDVVARILEERPALVLITGDFVYHAGDDPAPVIAEAVELVRPLVEAGLPTYAVLGNHDYAMKQRTGEPSRELARTVEHALEEAGIPVLRNESVALADPPAGDAATAGGPQTPLYLVGLDASWPENVDVEAALSGMPPGAPRVVMMHNPNAFARLPAGTAPLAVAGHTHGGQIRLPFTPEWSYLTFVESDAVHADGWIDGYGAAGNRLYVNRGIGMSTVPLRINCMPELTMFTLRRP